MSTPQTRNYAPSFLKSNLGLAAHPKLSQPTIFSDTHSPYVLDNRAISLGASCERGQGLVDNKNLPAHFHSNEIAVTNERNDVFFRQAELKPSFRERYE